LALAVSAIILTGIVALSSLSVNISTASRNKSQANRYAGEVIEFFRKEKEVDGWENLKNAITAGSGKWCLTDLSLSINTECDPANAAHFKRHYFSEDAHSPQPQKYRYQRVC
jgi:hypothetical protein